tara:strand:- start:1357 stop:1869 length:513 start_codon:yes stop_codon:yes gene_type:complete
MMNGVRRGVAAATMGAVVAGGCATQRASWVEMDERGRASAVIDAWHAAAARGDFEGYFSRMTPDAVFLGTDATERWGRAAFEDFARPYFDGVEAWTYLPRDRHLMFSGDGRTGWFDEMLDHAKYGELRGTGVVRRDGRGHWRVAHYSLTFTVPNELAPRVVDLIRSDASE